MSALPKRFYTVAEYLELESRSETKHEYINGEVLPWGDGGPQGMAGASTPHNRIAGSIFARLWAKLEGRPCEAFGSDMRVGVKATGLRAYPDVSALCGQPEIDPTEGDSLLNPTVLVEVLSDSTEHYDRGAKFAHYRRLESLREYVLVAQTEMRVELYRRQPNGLWTLQEFNAPEGRVELTSLECELTLREIYSKVTLPPPPRYP